MNPVVYQAFEEICSQAHVRGPVLEVGAVPGSDSLLRMACLQNVQDRVGINLVGAFEGGWEIIQGNANHMACFEDNRFQTVLCNATLEHDPLFWKTITEIHRVTAQGGLIVIGVPGFAGMGSETFAPRKSMLGFLFRILAKVTKNDALLAGTVTLGEHAFPGDYYRFTEQAMREVFLGDLANIGVRRVMNPPRILGWGRKP